MLDRVIREIMARSDGIELEQGLTARCVKNSLLNNMVPCDAVLPKVLVLITLLAGAVLPSARAQKDDGPVAKASLLSYANCVTVGVPGTGSQHSYMGVH